MQRPHVRRATRLGLLLLALPLTVLAARAEPGPATPAADGRVVVLGFDGADARTVRQLMAENPGAYPTFEKLAAEGTFAPLEVVAPPESPVSWAALNTGQNPAKTGVPGFIRRYNEFGGRSVPPIPFFGHIEADKRIPIEEFEDLPIPLWSPAMLGGATAGLSFLVGLLVGLLLFRGKVILAGGLGLVLGGAGFYAGSTVRGYLPEEIPVTANPNKAENFWDVAARNGVPTVVLDAAQAFSMPAPDGAKVLSGLGVPDARGGLGDWFVYTTDPDENERGGRGTTTAGTVYRVDLRGGEVDTRIFGPKNFWLEERKKKELAEVEEKLADATLGMNESMALSEKKTQLKDELKNLEPTAVDMNVRVGSGSADVTIGGQTQTVALGEWSEFFELSFELNPLLKVDAITRVRLVKLEPYFELFVNVLDVDPRNPPFWQPLSFPHDFCADLANQSGLYETYGWPTLTMPVKDGEVDPELLMEDVEFTMQWRERLTHGVLDQDDWRVLMSVFSTTDRVQHMMYQFYDEEHPLYDAEAADREMTFFGETIRLRDAIPAIYRHMDRVIGEVLAKLNPEDTLLVCSDHGFQSFRRQVNVNNWLAENGFLKLKDGLSPKRARTLGFVDWKETRVYSLGMGFLYVNQEGRELNGIVPPDQADAVMAEVREKLLAATDQDTGDPICKSVLVTKDVHRGPYIDLESDMLIGFAPNYRVSWSSTAGGLDLDKEGDGYVPAPVCVDNDSPWSGGHISVHLPDVAGVFFSNRKLDTSGGDPKALQIAPTVLQLVGVQPTADMDETPLGLN